MANFFPMMLLILVQCVCVSHCSEEHRICMSCPPVRHAHECNSLVEIWQHERCTIKLLLHIDGSTVYEFGYDAASACANSTAQTSPHIPEQQTSSTDIIMCHECCSGNLCNRRLCGLPEGNRTGLACLVGKNMGLPTDASITICEEGEQCYVGVVHNDRPHHPDPANYGCATQAVCDHFSSSLSGDGRPRTFQACCSQDGCNAFIAQLHEQNTGVSTATAQEVTQVNTVSTAPAQEVTHVNTVSTSTAQEVTQVNTISPTYSRDTTQTVTFRDCWDLQTRGGFTRNGIYDIYPASSSTNVRVRCDMTTDGGGWTVIQRRLDGSVNFKQTFEQYAQGFGDISGEYWTGLDWMHVLTASDDRPMQLRVDVCAFNGMAGFAVYDRFHVSSRTDLYRLQIGTYTRGDLRRYGRYDLSFNNDNIFTTSDGCAISFNGGWWFNNCTYVMLNGGNYNGGDRQGILWSFFGGSTWLSLRSSEMKIRPVSVTGFHSESYTCPH